MRHSPLNTFVQGLRHQWARAPDPHQAALRTLIIAPSFLAQLELQHSFTQSAQTRRSEQPTAIILPKMMVIGEIDEPIAQTGGQEQWLESIQPLERRLMLLEIIKQAMQETCLAQAVRLTEQEVMFDSVDLLFSLCGDFAQILDELTYQGKSLADLDLTEELAQHDRSGTLAEHWRVMSRALNLINERWQSKRRALSKHDVAEHFVRAVQAQIAFLRAQDAVEPRHRLYDSVFVIGSTGTIPIVSELLSTIDSLSHLQGTVLISDFPGDLCDAVQSDGTIRIADPRLPQHAITRLFAQYFSHITISEIPFWSPHHSLDDANSAQIAMVQSRDRLGQCLFRPDFSGHHDLDTRDLSQHLTLLRCEDKEAEAQTLALLLEQGLENLPSADAQDSQFARQALISNDLDLLERVHSLLQNRLEPELFAYTVGTPLAQSAVARFLLQLCTLLCVDATQPPERYPLNPDPLAVFAFLKHPLFALQPAVQEPDINTIEYRWRQGDDADPSGENPCVWAFLKRQCPSWEETLYAPLIRIQRLTNQHQFLTELLALAEHISSARALWSSHQGKTMSQVVTTLLNMSEPTKNGVHGLPYAGAQSIPSHVFQLLSRIVDLPETATYRPYRQAPIMLMGRFHARLLGFERVILGGMNDESWPPQPQDGLILSRQLRESLSLIQPLRQYGLSARDFCAALRNPEVIISRALRGAEHETVASAFFVRLETVLRTTLSPEQNLQVQEREAAILAWTIPPHASTIPQNQPEPPTLPAPTIANQYKPTTLSASGLALLMQNPYAFFTQYVLQLRPLPDLRRTDLTRLDLGKIMHRLCDALLREMANLPHIPSTEAIQDIVHKVVRKVVARELEHHTASNRRLLHAKAVPALTHIAQDYLNQNPMRSFVECTGSATLPIRLNSKELILKARADRIDLEVANIHIRDYKLGAIPAKDHVRDGTEPQLWTIAYILAQHGYADIAPWQHNLPKHTVTLSYWKLTDKQPKSEMREITDETEQHIFTQLEQYAQDTFRFAYIADPLTAQRNPSLSHLARVNLTALGTFDENAQDD